MPSLYEINTRVWLAEMSRRAGKRLTLADVPDEEVDRISQWTVDLVWLMGVWKVGPKAVEVARSDPGLAEEYRRVLGDFTRDDVIGSPYAVGEYAVGPGLGGREALAAFRKKLKRRGLGLVLDFVPNHTGLDHPWVEREPEFYVQGDREDLKREPQNYFPVETASGLKVLAHGKDPYFPGWTDTAQLNFLHARMRASLKSLLLDIALECDGVRCDMVILPLEEVFRRGWGERALRTAGPSPAQGEFWNEAIPAVRERSPRFLFLAEAYWGLEGRLQALGFDSTYDKVLYDRLVAGDAGAIRAHLEAPLDHQSRSARFMENHDEPRAAAVFAPDRHRAAAVLLATVPGLALYHEGQFEGRRVKLPVQLGRRPREPIDEPIRAFYRRLRRALGDPVLREGRWRLLRTRAAWPGNPTWTNFLAHEWEGGEGEGLRWVAINFGPTRGQCYVEPGRDLGGFQVELVDLLGEARYQREGAQLLREGLYLDLESFGFHIFRVELHPGSGA